MAEKVSIRKTRRLRTLLARLYPLPGPPEPQESAMEDVMMAILWQDAPPERARLAFVNLMEEFVDWNELRVSLPSEVAAVLESCGLKGSKATALKRVLGKAVEEFYSFEFERLRERPPGEVKAWFQRIEGLPHPLMAAILYRVYGYDGVLVGEDIARVMRRLGLVSEGATEGAIEEGLSKVIPAREAQQIHHALRQHALGVCTKTDFDCTACVLCPECATGKARQAETEAARKAEARAKAKAKKAKAAKKKTKKTRKTTRKKARKPARKRSRTASKSTKKKTSSRAKPRSRGSTRRKR